MKRTLAEVESQLRALKRQGSRLAAEHGNLLDMLEAYQDGLERNITKAMDLEQANKLLKKQLADCRDMRHKLLQKIVDMKRNAREPL